jgi:hypothetical protein
MSSPNIPKYGSASIAFNRKLKNGEIEVNSNRAFRNALRTHYEDWGLSSGSVERHMDHKDAGHIKARNKGGKDTTSNYMLEDRHDNRAHGDAPIKRSEMKKAGRI